MMPSGHDRVDAREPGLRRIIVAALFAGIVSCSALAAEPDAAPAADALATPDQIFAAALRQSIGSPARAVLGDQATVRLADGLVFIPAAPASRLLTVSGQPVPPGFMGLLVGPEGMDAPGIIRFVPAGFIDSDAALAWTADDLLSSLNDTVQRENASREQHNQQPREARRWVQPPRYNPETHQIAWAALIVATTAPRYSDGTVTYHAIGFGRDGYISLTVVSGMQTADEIGQMTQGFLDGLTFLPNKAYGDALPTDKRALDGLAGAMEVDTLHKAPSTVSLFASDTVVPLAGGVVAAIGALSLLVYIRRHLRREARRG
jgi:uncharacterized membrane-anchored protein